MSMGMWFYAVGRDKVEHITRQPACLESLLELDRAAGGPSSTFALNDEWDAIRFLLSDRELASIVPAGRGTHHTIMCFGGSELEGAPFDACTLLDADQSAHAALALQALQVGGFRRRLGSARFREAPDLYRGSIWQNPEQFEELVESFDGLERFFFGAAKRDEAVLSYVVI